MKIKGTIEDLKLKKRMNDHKNISRTFSGFVVSIVGSVHFCPLPPKLHILIELTNRMRIKGSVVSFWVA